MKKIMRYGQQVTATLPKASLFKPAPRPDARLPLNKVRDIAAPVDAAGPFYVHGRRASDLEERVYRVLKQLGWSDDRIWFQVNFLGGRDIGGQVLDYVLNGLGTYTVIFVNGAYWHAQGSNYEATRLKEEQVKNIMPSANVLSLFTADLVDDATALMTLLRRVGRGA